MRAAFRQDIANRLGYRITVAPLRDRLEDIAGLFLLFFERAAKRPIELTPGVKAELEAHEWREGNVEELRRLAVAAAARVSSEFQELHPHHLRGLLSKVHGPKPVEANDSLTFLSNASTETVGSVQPLIDTTAVVPKNSPMHASWETAQRLRAALIETMRPGNKPASLPDVVLQWSGVHCDTTQAKREFKKALDVWFDPKRGNGRQWAKTPAYHTLAEQIKDDPFLSALYRYSIAEIDADEAKKLIATNLERK